MKRDFTLYKYRQLCDSILRLSCPILTIGQFLDAQQPQELTIILRHDIDRSLSSALRMAELEATLGISATYYVRFTRQVFHASEIRQLYNLGHEVGYHYEALAKANGDLHQAEAIFSQELQQLREIVPVNTVSMHGSPLSRWHNLDLWQEHDLKDYDIKGEASLSVDYSESYYFTDTGRNWNSSRYNLRDHVASRTPVQKIASTDDLIKFIPEAKDCPVFISAHPNRWADTWLGWGASAVSDWIINQAKWLISLTRR
jgi:hypothetical protein